MLTTLMMQMEEKRKILWYDVGFFRVTCYKEAFISMFQEPLRNGWLCPGCPWAKLVYLKLRHGSPSERRTRSDSCFLREPLVCILSARSHTNLFFFQVCPRMRLTKKLNIQSGEILMLLISYVPFSVFDLHLKNQQPILVWFAQRVSLKVDIQSFWIQIYRC